MSSWRNGISVILLVLCVVLWFVSPFISVNLSFLGMNVEINFSTLLDLSKYEFLGEEATKMWFLGVYMIAAPIVSVIFLVMNRPLVVRIISACTVAILAFSYYYLTNYQIDLGAYLGSNSTFNLGNYVDLGNLIGWGLWALLAINIVLIILPKKIHRRIGA